MKLDATSKEFYRNYFDSQISGIIQEDRKRYLSWFCKFSAFSFKKSAYLDPLNKSKYPYMSNQALITHINDMNGMYVIKCLPILGVIFSTVFKTDTPTSTDFAASSIPQHLVATIFVLISNFQFLNKWS